MTKPIDTKWIGLDLGVTEVLVERGRLRFFAQVIGATDPIYSDVEAARVAGYRDLPAPPTFLFGADLESGSLTDLLRTLEVPVEKVLHGEQRFVYHAPVVAGDVIAMHSRVSDIYAKKNGALQFIVKETRALNQDAVHVADLQSVLVVRG